MPPKTKGEVVKKELLKEFAIADIVPFDRNPRKNELAVNAVMKSIVANNYIAPIIIDEKNVIIVGHTRLKALIELGKDKCDVLQITGLTDLQKKNYRILDNKTGEIAEWDFEILQEDFKLEELVEFGFDENDFKYLDTKSAKGALAKKYIVPPFSVLLADSGEWQDRKEIWRGLDLVTHEGREENLIGYSNLVSLVGISATSVFDPVLCEVMYRWFCPSGGHILDPFAGGVVRGYTAGFLGYRYTGIDLRKEQVEGNKLKIEKDKVSNVKYIESDSCLIHTLGIKDVDFLFSCPPYHDLEEYSENEKDLSNMDYEKFYEKYSEIIQKSCELLKNDSFACFVVGEIRDKYGAYKNFVSDTINAFLDAGMKFYNEIILVTPVGTLPIRTSMTFKSKRKVGKRHQNVLVFYKGDIKNITPLEDFHEEV